MILNKRFAPMLALSLAACLATGCSRQQSAIDAAKKDVATTGQNEEVVYVDGNGNTTLTMVSPAAPGSATPTITQTTVPAGTQASTGLPDWSGGAHPQARHAMRYKAPGVIVADGSAPVAPAATTGPAAVSGTPTAAPVPVNNVVRPGEHHDSRRNGFSDSHQSADRGEACARGPALYGRPGRERHTRR